MITIAEQLDGLAPHTPVAPVTVSPRGLYVAGRLHADPDGFALQAGFADYRDMVARLAVDGQAFKGFAIRG